MDCALIGVRPTNPGGGLSSAIVAKASVTLQPPAKKKRHVASVPGHTKPRTVGKSKRSAPTVEVNTVLLTHLVQLECKK